MNEAELETLFSGFPAWVERQDPEREYDYGNCNACAFAQYLKSLGHGQASCGGHMFSLRRTGPDFEFPDWLLDSLNQSTFGELSAALAEASK